jgi:hypothetical protein
MQQACSGQRPKSAKRRTLQGEHLECNSAPTSPSTNNVEFAWAMDLPIILMVVPLSITLGVYDVMLPLAHRGAG